MQARLGGALAIVSGRPIAALDRFLEPWRPVVAAEHGGLLRLADGTLCSPPPPDLTAVHAAADALAGAHPGLFLERKTATLALHYRSAPQLERLCKQTLSRLIDGDASLELLEGKYVVEVKPAGTNKGRAISMLMRKAPFSGRQPLFVGDDVTDEAGFRSAQALGGAGIKVGAGETAALHRCESPQSVRAWLDAALCSDGTTGTAIR